MRSQLGTEVTELRYGVCIGWCLSVSFKFVATLTRCMSPSPNKACVWFVLSGLLQRHCGATRQPGRLLLYIDTYVRSRKKKISSSDRHLQDTKMLCYDRQISLGMHKTISCGRTEVSQVAGNSL